MAAFNLKNSEDVKEYLKNLHIEYKFGCYSEKKPDGEQNIPDEFNLLAEK